MTDKLATKPFTTSSLGKKSPVPACLRTFVSYDCFIKTLARNPAVTKSRILDAAEELFAARSFHGVSLRELTEKAGVNLAAVNYHFRDKENLFQETLLRRLRELNAKRLVSLQEACARAEPAPPSLEAIISLLAQPLFDLHRLPGPGGRSFVYLLSRGLTESSPLTAKLLAEEYHPTLTRFGQLIRRHVPQLSPEEFLWRFSFVVGTLHHTLATLHQMADLTRGICRNDDYEGAMTRFVGCGAAIFRATSTAKL